MLGFPFVTALCITKNRRQWLPKAIACYQAQTYPNRELLIVADGADVRDLIPNDPSIRLLQIEEGIRIGEKRNFGCDRAAGEIIATWDDDDFSAPDRLADQVQRLEASGCAVTGYCPMLFTDGERWWQYVNGDKLFALGTSLCFRRSWWASHPFKPIQVGEDGAFIEPAKKAKEITVVPANELMYATIHRNNTSPRSLDPSNWKRVNCQTVPASFAGFCYA